MSDINFVRDGRVGDKVWDALYGNGTIFQLGGNSQHDYCVIVVFSLNGRKETFKKSGIFISGALPSLCWGHRGAVDQGSPPDRTAWIPEQPTWCWCGETEENMEYLQLVTYVNKHSGHYHTYDNTEYEFAEPCKSEHIPEYWPKEWI